MTFHKTTGTYGGVASRCKETGSGLFRLFSLEPFFPLLLYLSRKISNITVLPRQWSIKPGYHASFIQLKVSKQNYPHKFLLSQSRVVVGGFRACFQGV